MSKLDIAIAGQELTLELQQDFLKIAIDLKNRMGKAEEARDKASQKQTREQEKYELLENEYFELESIFESGDIKRIKEIISKNKLLLDNPKK